MEKSFMYTPPPQPPNVLAELWEMNKQTQQKLDVLIDIQRQMLEAMAALRAKE